MSQLTETEEKLRAIAQQAIHTHLQNTLEQLTGPYDQACCLVLVGDKVLFVANGNREGLSMFGTELCRVSRESLDAAYDNADEDEE